MSSFLLGTDKPKDATADVDAASHIAHVDEQEPPRSPYLPYLVQSTPDRASHSDHSAGDEQAQDRLSRRAEHRIDSPSHHEDDDVTPIDRCQDTHETGSYKPDSSKKASSVHMYFKESKFTGDFSSTG